MKRISVKEKPEVCPNCGFTPVGTILYGMPVLTEKLVKEMAEGTTVLGGCCIHPGQVEWACKNCGCEFKKV